MTGRCRAPGSVCLVLALLAMVVGGAGACSSAAAQPSRDSTRTLALAEGFNPVGWAADQDVTIALETAASVTDIFQFDAASKTFRSFGPDRPAFLNSAPGQRSFYLRSP